jgi:hypothetical protein
MHGLGVQFTYNANSVVRFKDNVQFWYSAQFLHDYCMVHSLQIMRNKVCILSIMQNLYIVCDCCINYAWCLVWVESLQLIQLICSMSILSSMYTYESIIVLQVIDQFDLFYTL